MAKQPHHSIEGGSRRHGFHFTIYSPDHTAVGTLRKLKSESAWRLEVRLPSKRRVFQMLASFDEAIAYLERLLPIMFGQDTKLV